MKIDLGCGRRKADGYFGIDCQMLSGVDLVCDCNNSIPLPDSIAAEVRAYDFLEHVGNDKRIHIMTEIWRILKPGGIFHSMTPSTDGRGAFQDPTHYSFWNQNSFWYFTDDAHRALYDIKPKFDVISINTTEMNNFGICYVMAALRCVKADVLEDV
jgi:predicted SAM-dependent methyltransferase